MKTDFLDSQPLSLQPLVTEALVMTPNEVVAIMYFKAHKERFLKEKYGKETDPVPCGTNKK